MVGARVATSPEAEALLEAMPKTVRSLATSLQTQTERCLGSLRGPVLWSETMSARASSFGDEGLFVCKTPSRAYDIDENRVLVAALDVDPRLGPHRRAQQRARSRGSRSCGRPGATATRPTGSSSTRRSPA